MAAYRLAIAQGADYLEPDLVMTADGVLVCRHETELSATTDVARHHRFAQRRATRSVDGRESSGWFVEDFTLAELRTLRCREPLPELRPASARFDGLEGIPTFTEVAELARRYRVGLYPELKHPRFLASRGLDPVPVFEAVLRETGLPDRGTPVFVQCFERGPLERLHERTGLRTVQLVAAEGGPADLPGTLYADLLGDLRQVARYADGIGVEKSLIIPRESAGRLGPPTDLVSRAHATGLLVHAWTFRAENRFLPVEFQRGSDPATHGDLEGEIARFLALGLDGVFSDFPGIASHAVRHLTREL